MRSFISLPLALSLCLAGAAAFAQDAPALAPLALPDDAGKAARQNPVVVGRTLQRAIAVDHRLYRDADLGQRRVQDLGKFDLSGIRWVIVGGESGPVRGR